MYSYHLYSYHCILTIFILIANFSSPDSLISFSSFPSMPPKSARVIRSENADPSLKDGVLSVPEFVASREFEIKSMEQAQLNSKYASSTRVFQSLPRTLRRRAASHNVKRIPKRLRNRALREMHQSLAGASGPSATKPGVRGRKLYRLKMSRKLLKLAAKLRMLRQLPSEGSGTVRERIKSLSKQIEDIRKESSSDSKPILNNDMGSCDIVGENKLASPPPGRRYAKRQLRFVWTPTHIWHAKRFHMIKQWGFQIPQRPTQKCYRATNRAARTGAIAHETLYYGTMVAKSSNVQALVAKLTNRIGEPSQKTYHGWIYAPHKVTKGLVWCFESSVMIRVHPAVFTEVFEFVQLNSDTIYDCRYALGSLELAGPRALSCLSRVVHVENGPSSTKWLQISRYNCDSVPVGTTFVLGMKDPRFWKHSRRPPVSEPQPSLPDLIISMSSSDATSTTDAPHAAALLSSELRNNSYKNQHTTKQLSDQFQRTSPLANSIAKFVIDSLPSIPIFVTKTATTWCVICPWFWILPLWIKLVLVPEVHVGGAKQLHQINYERGHPTFPTDYPFLAQGWSENLVRLTVSKSVHDKLPQSKRKDYRQFENTVDPFGCDWFFLQKIIFGTKLHPNVLDGVAYGLFDAFTAREIHSMNDLFLAIEDSRLSQDHNKVLIELFDKNNSFHQQFAAGTYKVEPIFPPLPVHQVKLELINKGTISDHARIYRVPRSLLNAYRNGTCADKPDLKELIGFVTSGAYNLKLGNCTGIGCISADHKDKYVLVRNSGETLTRLAIWSKTK